MTASTDTAAAGRSAHAGREALIRGEGCFVGDLRIPGTLHLAVVRSPFARGRIASLDTSAALALPGVVDAFTAADVAPFLLPIPSRIPIPEEAAACLQPPLPTDEVRYAGQPVAVVVAHDATLALDAAELVELEIDVEPVGEPEPLVAQEVATGDVDAAVVDAFLVVRERFTIDRQAGMPVEPRGILATFDPETRELVVHQAAKAPHHLRDYLAEALGLDPAHVQVVPVDAGGGFGTRGELHPEEALTALAAFRLGRPVSWIETRTDNLRVAYQSRGQQWDAALAVDADGRIVALDGAFRSDVGGYVGPNGLTPGFIALRAFLGPYRVPSYRCRADHLRSWKVPLGTVRGPGYFEAAFVRERLLDLAAADLGLDPTEIRRRNLVTAAEMPFTTGLPGQAYDGGDYAAMLERALAASPARAAPTDGRVAGVGVSCTVEASGTPGTETAVARLEQNGGVTLELASSSFGQGHAEAFAGIAASVLGVDPSRVSLVEGDTRSDVSGGGTFASRTAMMAGSACLLACRALREAILDRAGAVLGPGAQLSDADLAALAPLEAQGTFSATGATYTFGATVARVEVDPATGAVTLVDLVVVADAGVLLDAAGAEAQLRGGAVHGIGGALFERVAFDEDGESLAVSLRDYHVPGAADLPRVTAIALADAPSPANPLGARGLGEISTAGAGAAVANAVADALRGTGARVTRLPVCGEDLVLTAGKD